MCQSGQDSKEVNDLIEQILDYYWPYDGRRRGRCDHHKAKSLWKLFGLKAEGKSIIRAWAQYESTYNKHFGERMCTRELDKFFLTETLRIWEDK